MEGNEELSRLEQTSPISPVFSWENVPDHGRELLITHKPADKIMCASTVFTLTCIDWVQLSARNSKLMLGTDAGTWIRASFPMLDYYYRF